MLDSQHAEREHSIFSPSASPRWLACPGSLQPALLAPRTSSPYAEEGTRAHEVAEALLSRTGAHLFAGLSSDLREAVLSYVHWANEGAEGADTVLIEERVDHSHLTPLPNQRGTLDHAALFGHKAGGLAVLTDLKTGVGVKVYAERNSQMMIYALGILEAYDFLFDFKRFDLRICQPRLDHYDTWEISRADLLAFGEYVKERAALALQPGAPRVAGDHCRKTFCPLMGDCPAHADLLAQLAEDGFEDVTPTTPERASQVTLVQRTMPPVEALTVEQMARLLAYRKTVEGWFAAMHRKLESEVAAGAVVMGWRMVESRTRRKWADDDTALLALHAMGVNAVKRSVAGPAEAEAMLIESGMKRRDAVAAVADLTVKPPGRPTLARVGDDREEYGDVLEGMYTETEPTDAG